jgi:ankyrin repeat protein
MINVRNRQRVLLGALLAGLASCSGIEPPAGVDIAAEDYRPSNLLEAVLLGDRASVDRFIASGATVDSTEVDGTTPLMRAIHGHYPEIAARLISAGADVSAANRYGVTPLYLAARAGDAASARALLAAGAKANTSLNGGETVLMTAAKAGSVAVVRTLLTGGHESLSLAALSAPAPEWQPPVVTSGYGSFAPPSPPQNRADVNAREGWYGQTALMWAAAEGHTDVVRLLIEAGADVAAISRELAPADSAAELSQSNLDYANVPRGRRTALHLAARAGHIDTVEVLIDAGAPLNAVDASGMTALDYAEKNGFAALARLLRDRGGESALAPISG